MKFNFIYPILIAFALNSCESVIEPDFKNTAEQLVIEGEIDNISNTGVVKISKTTAFTASSQFIGVENALVIISDDMGTIDTLTMTEPGIYKSSKITGTEQHQYNLKLEYDNKTYSASCVMPKAVAIDTLYTSELNTFGQILKFINTKLTDPLGIDNQYRYKIYINDVLQKNQMQRGNVAFNDEFFDGEENESSLSIDNEFVSGDVIKIELLCIDKSVYTYFKSLSETLNSQNAVPANPISNIKGGCLGYFSAHAVSSKLLIVE